MIAQEYNLTSMFPRTRHAQLPRLNDCGVSNERQNCCPSADEIFFTFNEPFFGNMSLTQFLSYGDMLA